MGRPRPWPRDVPMSVMSDNGESVSTHRFGSSASAKRGRRFNRDDFSQESHMNRVLVWHVSKRVAMLSAVRLSQRQSQSARRLGIKSSDLARVKQPFAPSSTSTSPYPVFSSACLRRRPTIYGLLRVSSNSMSLRLNASSESRSEPIVRAQHSRRCARRLTIGFRGLQQVYVRAQVGHGGLRLNQQGISNLRDNNTVSHVLINIVFTAA